MDNCTHLYTSTMNAQPLYLQNGSAIRLDLDLTQRLRIERKDLPERRIPLHHVSRIVCSSTLDISARALMACMKSGIPLAVVDTRGEPLGWCLGARRKESSLRQRHGFDSITMHKRPNEAPTIRGLRQQNLLSCIWVSDQMKPRQSGD